MRLSFNDPEHIALRRAVRTTVGVTIAMAAGLRFMPGSPGLVLAAFGTFAILGFADFGGSMGRRLVALLATGIAGLALIAIGIAAATSVVSVVLVTFVVTGGLAYIVVLRGAFANAVPALTVIYVVTVMVGTSTSYLGSMMLGYLLAVGLSIPITLFILPRRTPRHIRDACVTALRTLAAHERRRAAQEPRDLEGIDAAIAKLHHAYLGNPFRSTGIRRSDRALVTLVGQLQGLLVTTRQQAEAPRPLSDLPGTQEFIGEAAQCLDALATALEQPHRANPSAAKLVGGWVDQWDEAVRILHDCPDDQLEKRLRTVAHAFPDRAMAIATIRVAILVRRVLNLPDEEFDTGSHTVPDPPDFVPWKALRTQFTLKSPWMRTALRTGFALAMAAGVVEIVGLAHGFWVLLGVIATLRLDSLNTLRTSLFAVGGTFAGALVGAIILILAGGDEPIVVVLFLVTAFLAVLFQGTISFVVAQAMFSLYVVLTFTIVTWPPDLSTATDRVVDIAVGAAVSLVTAFLLWPRGVLSGLRGNVVNAIEQARDLLHRAMAELIKGGDHGAEAAEPTMRAAMARSQEVVEVMLGSHSQDAVQRAIHWQQLQDLLRTLSVTGILLSNWSHDRPPLAKTVPPLVAPLEGDEESASREWELVRDVITGEQMPPAKPFAPIVPRAVDRLDDVDLHDVAVADRVVGALWSHGWLELTYASAVAARAPAETLSASAHS